MVSQSAKPLNGKAYGSIGHLPKSRLGPGDWHVHEGQARICCEKPRRGDTVIVTEKLDGACMSIANIDNDIVALSRAGYLASSSKYDHIQLFSRYAARNASKFSKLLRPGERIVGEWLAMAHGTIYDIMHHNFAPFIAFDIFRDKERILYDEFVSRCDHADIQRAALIYQGAEGCSIEFAMQVLGTYGFHGAIDPAEGAVWRVEREGRVDFLAKYVRHEKVDGKYLIGIKECVVSEPVWLWYGC